MAWFRIGLIVSFFAKEKNENTHENTHENKK